MASSYTTNSGIEKPSQGSQTGEWGTTINTNMDIIDRSINGVLALSLSGTTTTLTTTDGTLTDGMYKVLVLGGSPSGTNTITVAPNDADKLYFVVNSSGQTATFTQGSGANVNVLNGDTAVIYCDGAGSGAAVADFTKDLGMSSVNIDGGTIDGVIIGGASAAAGTFTTLDTSGAVNLNLTTDSSSSTSGALIIDGGVGIAKKLYVGTDADIDGTLEADAMTLNGSAITTTATLSTGISNTNVPVFTSGVADDDFLRVAGTSIEGRSASEVLSDIGGQASLTFGISNTNAVKIDSASVADDEYARFTANGLESRSTAEVLSDIGASAAAGSSSIVTTGALDAGSITSGFGAIDNGSSTITTTGAVATGALTAGGILKTDDTTAATSTTDGSLQTDGGLSVAGDAVIGDDLLLLSDGAIMKFGADSEIVVTHVADTGLRFSDSDQLQFGDGGDLKIYHDASNSYVEDAGTGVLVLKASQLNINSAGDESMAAFVADGAATLYHNNVAKLATTATGVTVTGDISTVTSINTGQIANRNAVQNGAMMVDQKGGTTTLSGYSAAKPDRFTAFVSNAGTQTVAQDSEAPAGFHKSLKATNTVVDSSIASGDRAAIIYRLEGNDAARFAFGGSDAKTVTLSFYVRSSITGTHGGALGNGADNRSYPFTYAISSADTWERKSITIAGDTTGTWATSTARSMQIVWGLGVGSTNSGTAGEWAAADYNSATGATTAFLTTLNATWYLTGVQLEEGSTATDFEHKSFSQEFTACSRYFQKSYTDVYTGLTGFGIAGAAGAWRERVNFNGYMRAGPTMAYTNLGTGWSAANINSCESHFTVELSKNTADIRPNFQYTANAEL